MTDPDRNTHAGTSWTHSCPRCRYDTTGLPAERCPECGITYANAESLRLAAVDHVPRWLLLKAFASLPTLVAAACMYILLAAASLFGFGSLPQPWHTSLLTVGGILFLTISILNWAFATRSLLLLRLWWIALFGVVFLTLYP